MSSIRTKLVTAAAIANAASSSTTTTPAASGSATQSQKQHDPSKGGHQRNGKTETLLTGDTAAKVKAAALAKADGTEVEVTVNSDFSVAAVNAMGGRHP